MEFPRKEYPDLCPGQHLEFQITDWFIPEADRTAERDNDELYTILMYGSCDNGATVCAKVIDYIPYFYIKPPVSWENLSDGKFNMKFENLKQAIISGSYQCTYNGNTYDRKIIPRNLEKHLKDITVIKKRDFWGFTNNKVFRFIKISFKSLKLYNSLKYYFISLEKSEGYKLYESNIDPFLKYIHIQNIKPCGWVKIEKYETSDDISRCNYNIVVKHKYIIPIDINKIAPLIIASFDIECTSSHGDFPVAIKDYRKVAQDLSALSKAGYDYDADSIINWIQNIYIQDVMIDDSTDLKINRVYSKKKITKEFLETLPVILKRITGEIIISLDKISHNISSCENDEEDEEDEVCEKKSMNVRELNEEETKITQLLNKVLPPLEGDKIIQIGTTVHRYGSEKIIYKNIMTLNTCDNIEDCDVVECKTEKQLLYKWKELMNELNPDIITGYNIFGFDMEYIWLRVKECCILDEFSMGLGRLITKKCSLIEQKLSSSAMGENILKYFEMDGIVMVDLFKVMQREQKLDSYKLDNVATIFLGDKKDDLKPNEIFQKFKGNSTDRCVIAKYCIQDCALVNRLIHKLKIIENNIGMGNVCLVPLNFLFRRGQGIKIFSLIAKQCMDKGLLIPSIKSFNEIKDTDDGYEGAVVLEPKEGIYLNEPIVVFDYGSLYPSSMISCNLSHDCYLMDEKYKVDDPNIEYKTISYDLYEGVGDKKKKSGVKECVFVQYKDGKKGIIAEILDMLLKERKNTRNKIEYRTLTLKDSTKITGLITKDSDDTLEINNMTINKKEISNIQETYNNFEKDVFDALQSAYKITANSLYGQIGARTSPIYLKEIAACTTSTGREMIMLAKNYVETYYNAEVIYGDSVMPYTPITYKNNDIISISTFEKLEGEWFEYNKFKPFDTDRYDKEQFVPQNMLVWTHKGWTNVKRVIRHKTTKKIYRVITQTGLVDVTADHSLLNNNCEIIKPSDCIVGQKLLHSMPNILPKIKDYDDIEQSYIYGVFVCNGSCDSYNDKYSWAITNSNIELLNKCKELLEKIEKIPFEILDTSKSSGVYKLLPNSNCYKSVKNIAEKYIQKCYLDKEKIIPRDILNGDINNLEYFRRGLCDSYGNINEYIDIKNQVKAQSYFVMFQILGYNVSINIYDDKPDIYRITYTKNKQLQNPDAIKKIDVLYENYTGYVYDIETEVGVFHSGIGNIILKNTDSIFCKFPLKDDDGNDVYGKEALPFAIKAGKSVEKNIVGIMPKPQKLNYEKSLYPFILFSKKRYVGNLYESDITKFKQKSMGIVLKRRDNAQIVKKIYGGIIDIILNKQDINSSIEFLQEELDDLVNGKTIISDLVISKSLRGSYKDPTKIAHKVLADRIGSRDPGNRPAVNDRIPFVYIKTNNPTATLQGDRIENPDYIVANNLSPDYLHYITNQIMKPVLQLYALCLDQLPNYDKEYDYWEKQDIELKKREFYSNDIKRKNRIDNLKLNTVKELLFDKYINMLIEPKTRKKKSTAVIKEGENVVVKPKIKKNAVIKTEEENSIVKPIIDNNILIGTVKVVKSKTEGINSSAYITIKNKKVWTYDNKNCSCKNAEIMDAICIMIEKNHKEGIIISIKLNNAQFIKDYNMALGKYHEFIINKDKQFNLVDNAINSLDIGIMKDITLIKKYEKLLLIKDKFVFNV